MLEHWFWIVCVCSKQAGNLWRTEFLMHNTNPVCVNRHSRQKKKDYVFSVHKMFNAPLAKACRGKMLLPGRSHHEAKKLRAFAIQSFHLLVWKLPSPRWSEEVLNSLLVQDICDSPRLTSCTCGRSDCSGCGVWNDKCASLTKVSRARCVCA